MNRRSMLLITGLAIVLGLGGLLMNARLGLRGASSESASSSESPLADVSSAAAPSAASARPLVAAVAPSGASSNAVTALEVPPATREKIAACLSKAPKRGKPGSASELRTLDALVGSFGESATELEFENFHVKKSDGEVLRLRVVPSEAQERRVRVFSVDAEGLPVPEALPESLRDVAPAEAAARFRALGEPVFESRKTTRRFSSGLSASVVEENGRVTELQVFFSGGSLGCAWSEPDSRAPFLDCQCL